MSLNLSNQPYPVTSKPDPTFFFIGVTTAKSSINKIFPQWMKEIGRQEVLLEGVDLKIHDQPEAYRQVIAQIKFDPLSLGGLVTTHKIDLLAASLDLFDFLNPYARICGEVSSISKRDGNLEGHALDPISSGLSLDAILGESYFETTGGEVLCFGAGGSAIATLLHLINKQEPGDRPKRFILVNRSPGRLENARRMVAGTRTDIKVEYICNAIPELNDEIMAGLKSHSLVINATGMGKDTPGSPVTDQGQFPKNGIAWEFNYRGELDFLHQARSQVSARDLRVEDGWLYFVHGWTLVVAQVLHIDLTPMLFGKLEAIATANRKP
jgi:shikimate dehydrogenase